VILVLEVIVGNMLTRRITDPLTSLARGARAVARGRLETRVEVAGSDEIGTLTESFNRMTGELGGRIRELSKLNEAIRAFSGSLEREPVLERAVLAFRDAADPDGLVLAMGHEEEVELAAGTRDGKPLSSTRLPAAELEEGLLRRALTAGAPEVWTDLTEADVAPRERELFGAPGSAAAIPFHPHREITGAFLLTFRRPDPGLSQGELQFLSTLAQQVGIALENARLYQLAIEDSATGLYVHSYFLARLREETDRALGSDRPLSVVLVSLEELPGLYETYGTDEGDHVLVQVVRRLRTALRGMHIMARADRETIEVLLPEIGKEAALTVAQAIRDALARSVILLAGDPSRTFRLTPSIGLATCPDDARSAEFLLSEAQQALLKAVTDREGGRLVDVGRERQEQREVRAREGRYVFRSEKMTELLETVDRIAASDVPILLQGETGVGKEVVAEVVHECSARRGKPLVKVNCAALPETLLESELFGHERGAFTGAERRRPGRFELADGGTIFLDEIGEIPVQTQVKLLRVLQDHRIERLGGTSPIQVDVRVIAATNRDLLADIREGRFREDLYFRLNVVSLVVPPLRARKEEIPALADHFLEAHRRSERTTGKRLSPAAMDRLFSHDWPGNVRELRNTIERALVIARADEVQEDEIVFPDPTTEERPRPAPPSGAPAPPSARDPGHVDLNPRQRKLLEILARRESITNREYVDLVGVSSRTGNRDLHELIERGLILQIGKRRAAIYRLPE
jgi:diguanylate cyclase (GGDEF)-like protein